MAFFSMNVSLCHEAPDSEFEDRHDGANSTPVPIKNRSLLRYEQFRNYSDDLKTDFDLENCRER